MVDFSCVDVLFAEAGLEDAEECDLVLFGLGGDEFGDAVLFDFVFGAVEVFDPNLVGVFSFCEFSCDSK